MQVFTDEYLAFLRELPANNNRDWFDANKGRFKEHVEKPFHNFISQVIDALQADDPSLQPVTAKDCVYRIYRDVRFSADKSPYKEHMAALISAAGRKGDMHEPGIYLESNGEEFRMYSGAYMPGKEHLERIRTSLGRRGGQFRALIESADFKQHFGEIHGQKNKRLPKPFADWAEYEPLIFNKAFYFYKIWPAEAIYDLAMPRLVQHSSQIAKPVNDFLFA